MAYRFRRWVTDEVLPTIRRTGGYAVPAVAPVAQVPAPVTTRAALLDLLRNPTTALELIGHYASENLSLHGQVEAAAPAIALVAALADTDETLCLQDAGKALGAGTQRVHRMAPRPGRPVPPRRGQCRQAAPDRPRVLHHAVRPERQQRPSRRPDDRQGPRRLRQDPRRQTAGPAPPGPAPRHLTPRE